MRSANALRRLRGAAGAALLGLGLVLGSCAEGFAPLSQPGTPMALQVSALRPGVVSISWERVEDVDANSYIIERRANLTGNFTQLATVPQNSLARILFIDTDVETDTYYGYRVRTLSGVGDRSAPSVTGGVRTPPPPGIEIVTTTQGPSADALDPDGYVIAITGVDTLSAPLGVNALRRFAPLQPGSYRVALRGLASRCTVSGDTARIVSVNDTTAQTIANVRFQVDCTDPNRAEIAVSVTVTGEELDQEFFVDVIGQASDPTLPDAERLYTSRRSLPLASPRTRFQNLRPGSYEVSLDDVASNCTVQGESLRNLDVGAAATVNVAFVVNCLGPPPVEGTEPFVWRNTWSASSAAPGSQVSLDLSLDLTAIPATRLLGVQSDLLYDPAVLRFDEETARQLPVYTINSSVPGVISFIANTTPTALRSGVVQLMRFGFTVIGAAGDSTRTRTQNVKASDRTTAGPLPIQDSIRVVEGVLRVSGGGSGGNTAPIAVINGPYSGQVGSAVNFSSSGSSDPGGSIASYLWTFGDNTTSTVANPSKTYAAAGSYQVSLAVTDNGGLVSTANTTAAISAASGGNSPPTAVINGPYSGQVGTPINFSSAGSSDAGGSITSYLWTFGDNTSSTLANPSKVYSTAGTYTVTLAVTDNGGLVRSVSTTAAVSPAPSGNQPPVARANGPYTATVGQAVTLSSAGSSDPDGSIVLYQWSLGDGRTISGASPSVTYATAGTYNITLTVTDNGNVTGTATSSVVVAPAAVAQPLLWRSTFGPVDIATGIASITVSYDLRTNIAETPGSEALQSFALDSIKWNASLLQFQSISLGPNIAGTSNQAGVNDGRLSFRGTISGAQQQGLITIATLRFRIVGAAGARVTTLTALGPLIGAASTGTFVYNAKTAVIEGDLVLP